MRYGPILEPSSSAEPRSQCYQNFSPLSRIDVKEFKSRHGKSSYASNVSACPQNSTGSLLPCSQCYFWGAIFPKQIHFLCPTVVLIIPIRSKAKCRDQSLIMKDWLCFSQQDKEALIQSCLKGTCGTKADAKLLLKFKHGTQHNFVA